MKLALLGDIHSNYRAFEKCLSYCEEIDVDGYVFLGDYISDCPYPQKTLELIKSVIAKYNTWIIRGNREDYQINHHEGDEDGWHDCSNSGSLLYTYDNLEVEDIEFFKACDITMKITLPGMPELTICHGSPNSSRELLHIESPLAQEYLTQSDTKILICAHTHVQGLYEYNGKTLINPGSVGISVASNGKSQFAILHGNQGEWIPEFLSLEYDIEQFIQEYNTSELPSKAATFTKVIQHFIQTGHNILSDVMETAEILTLAAEGTVNPADMPEKYWEEAYQQIINTL